MRNLWIFISKYNAFFLFVVFFVSSVVLIVSNNSFQQTSALNTSNQIIGNLYQRVDLWKSYFHLNETNKTLARENANLRALLKQSQFDHQVEKGAVLDTGREVRYRYIEARVINNSIHQINNYITLNRGSNHGIHKGMGVVSSRGVVGIVLHVSPHFSTVQSVLHSDTRISASLEKSDAFGSLVWGENNRDPKIAFLRDIPNHIPVVKGERVATSGYSLFPEGILIGKVVETGIESGESFFDIRVQLNNDFSTLQYVYVVTDDLATEKEAIEEKNKEHDG